ncbi:MAG: YggS family pyridoxal phosphate-dependent enzyme [Bacteroidota bacterium]|nr:YggS family pyridoxal phosphate-dependent enzyme [Bacteroidota bacterium]
MNTAAYYNLLDELKPMNVQLLAVSKTRTPVEIQEMYELGQRDFGENYVQELVDKQTTLPTAIRWHFIGHLQSNKVKYIAPFVYMIQGVDSLRLLLEIEKQAKKNHRVILCLLQVHIAREETKFGFSERELMELAESILLYRKEDKLAGIHIAGLMGMASLTEDQQQIRDEFKHLKTLFDRIKKTLPEEPIQTLSMGMSSDYPIAIQEGSTMIRIGTALFGERSYTKG